MKKCIALLLSLLLLLPVMGCAQKPEIVFYYPRREIQYGTATGVIDCEGRSVSGHENDLTYLLKLYLEGPVSQDLYAAFPKGTVLQSLTLDESVMHITLSGKLDTLSGLEYSIACVSMASTCFGLTDAQTVIIAAETPDISEMTINRDSIALSDTSAFSAPD